MQFWLMVGFVLVGLLGICLMLFGYALSRRDVPTPQEKEQ